jgi:hypothetical protein
MTAIGSATTLSPSFGAIIGEMYARWTLDCFVEIAHAVSIDYAARPEFYHDPGVPDEIASLRVSYGYSSHFPDRSQRNDLSGPAFGASDGYPAPKGVTAFVDQFRRYREPLFRACIAYTQRSIADATAGLKQDVIQAMSYFPSYLRNFDGASLRSSSRQLRSISDLAYEILRSGAVAVAFGVNPPPNSRWPMESDDQRGSQLISAISDKLQLKDSGLAQDQCTKLRTMAQDGASALEAVLLDDPTSERNFEALVQKVYAWAKSIDYYWNRA